MIDNLSKSCIFIIFVVIAYVFYRELNKFVPWFSQIVNTMMNTEGYKNISDDFILLPKLVLQGLSYPLEPEPPISITNTNGPPIDGDNDSPKNMFILSHNKCSLDCCPSIYTCDKGCVCLSDRQKKYISNKK